MNEHAKLILAALERTEQTHRAHGRAVAELHRALARAATEHGDDGLRALAAAPKNPPTNPGD